MSLPIRSNLVAQTVDILASEIANGKLYGELPGEFPLCDRLQISRTTLRAALQLMEKRGYFRKRVGRRRQILKPKRASARFGTNRSVRLITGLPLHCQTRHTNAVLSQVMLSLQSLGFECAYLADKKFTDGAPDNLLGRLCVESPHTIWILISCSVATQAWLYQRGCAAFVLGHLHQGIHLPAIDVDLKSAGRHAAAQFLSHGHRKIGLILADPCSAGDLSVEAGFAETMEKPEMPRGTFTTIKMRWERHSMVHLVQGLLRRPDAPTALFILSEETAVCLYSLLIRRGIRVPEDISIIVRDGGELLERFSPDFARYKVDLSMEVRRTCHIVSNFVSNRALHPNTHLLMPEFHLGETLAKL